MASFGDFNRVNTNVTALSAQLSLNKINSELGDSRLKLSTGKRINSAEDNSAGYAIATKLNSRVKGLEQALQNVSDAKSMLDVVEGAYKSIIDNLIDLKRLANQAATDTIEKEHGHTLSDSQDIALIAAEMEAIGDRINDTSYSASFNGVSLLDESVSNINIQSGETTTDTFQINLSELNMSTLFTNTISGGDNEHGDPHDFLGDTVNGGISRGFIPANQALYLEKGSNYHSFYAFDADLVPDKFINPADEGSTIVVRGKNIDGSSFNNKLLIDQELVNAADMRSFMGHIDTAIDTMNSKVNELGIDQRSLSSKEENLTQAITATSAAHTRIMDTDFAKEQSNSIRLQILQQTATAALSQANMGPQAVLRFLGQ